MSCITCRLSHVTCQMSPNIFIFLEASRWRVCYQQGLPRLVDRQGVAKAGLQTPLRLIN